MAMFPQAWLEPFKALGFSNTTANIAVFIVAHGLLYPVYLLWARLRRPAELDLPVVGDPNAPDFREAMEEGARKVGFIKARK